MSVAVTIAVGVNTDGPREVPGMAIGACEAEPFWTGFLRDLVRLGLSGVKLVIGDAHEGIEAATARVLSATWPALPGAFPAQCARPRWQEQPQTCLRLHRHRLCPAGQAAAKAQWRLVAEQMRSKLPKLATLMDTAEEDMLAYMTFPAQHRAKLLSANPIERLNGEIKRRSDLVGILPNEAAIRRLVGGAILMEQTEEWTVQRGRYMTPETLAPVCDNVLVRLPAAQPD